MKLKGKTVIVVGATGGIGNVLAHKFHGEGANVVLAARTKHKLEELAGKLGRERTLVMQTDASKAEDVIELFQEAREVFGQVDAVVISAGTWQRLSIEHRVYEAVELVQQHFQAIFLPSFVVGFVAQRFFRDQEGGGLIINISSHAAIRPELSGNLTYGPMKAAAWHFMSALMHEIKDPEVRVVDLKPAIVNTPENTALDTPEKRVQAVQPSAIAEWIIDHFHDPDDRLPTSVDFPSSLTLD